MRDIHLPLLVVVGKMAPLAPILRDLDHGEGRIREPVDPGSRPFFGGQGERQCGERKDDERRDAARHSCGLLPVWSSQRSEEHTSELQSRLHLVCRLLLEKKKKK